MEARQFKPIAVLGAGSWGTALALYLARRGQTVHLWSILETEISDMLRDGSNERYLPGHKLPDTLHPMANLREATSNVEDVLIVVPSIGLRKTLSLLKPLISSRTRLICASKGLDNNTGQLSNEIVSDVLGEANPFAVLSGPSFAKEVAAGLPTAVVIASKDNMVSAELMQRFSSPIFHVYPSHDIIGVEVGGVVKNVIAIGAGIIDGLKLGKNAQSALITCGLAEITRLGVALGGHAETFVGLAGLGDLILTCSDNQSRNRRLGLAIGEGKSIGEAEREIGQVVEGKRNAELVMILAKKHQVSMPICHFVNQILQDKLSAIVAVNEMLSAS